VFAAAKASYHPPLGTTRGMTLDILRKSQVRESRLPDL
jgi:hypothetical protein